MNLWYTIGGGLKQQKLIFSQFWILEFPDQGPAGLVSDESCISQCSPEKQNQQDLHMGRDPYKDLAHIIMEAEKPQDMQLTCWRPRRADAIIPVWVQRQNTNVPVQRGNSPLLSLIVLFRLCWVTQPTFELLIQTLISSRNTLSDQSRIMFDHIFGHPMAQSSWQVKLIIRVVLLACKGPPSCCAFTWHRGERDRDRERESERERLFGVSSYKDNNLIGPGPHPYDLI